MKTDLTREQILSIVANARHQRSLAAGEVSAQIIRQTLAWVAKWGDRGLHALLMSPNPR